LIVMDPDRLRTLLEVVRAVQDSVSRLERELMAVLSESQTRAAHAGHTREGSEEWFTLAELGEWLKVSRTTVYKLMSTGQIPSYRVGRTVRIRRRDVESWLETNGPYP
jgi:excisionase family DNA binding protein